MLIAIVYHYSFRIYFFNKSLIMILIEITTPQGIKKARIPQGRHEVTYDQWNKAYPYIQLIDEANKDYEAEDYDTAALKSIQAICHIISELSEGVNYPDIVNIQHNKVLNIFLTQFAWLGNEVPKQNFVIDGQRFSVPKFIDESAMQFIDTMGLIQASAEDGDHDKGLLIAAIYVRNHLYTSSLEDIESRKEFFKKHAKMDLFYSCAFFLRSSMNNYKLHTPQPLLEEAVVRLTSDLGSWVTSLYSQALWRAKYS